MKVKSILQILLKVLNIQNSLFKNSHETLSLDLAPVIGKEA